MNIAIKVLKLDYPKDFKPNMTDEQIRKIIKKDRYIGIGTQKNNPVYNNKEIQNLKTDDLKRALYWSEKRTGGHIKGLCEGIEKWFEKTKWNGVDMLIPDKQGGTAGGHIKISTTQSIKKQELHVKKIVPEQNEIKFKTYLKRYTKNNERVF